MPDEIWLQIIKNKLEDVLGMSRLEKLVEDGRRMKVKFGIDPTAANIHIGHTVPLNIVNAFLKKGHEIAIVIGDFTAMIGDPSGRSSERKTLTTEQVDQNMRTYIEQIGQFIDVSKVSVHRNSEWISRFTPAEIFETLSLISLSQATQREDFHKRMANGSAVTLAEVCYSILMGIDSVALECDVEVGGVDQLLNFHQCREVMRRREMEPEIALMTPILEGTSGDGRKMSKSYGNAIAVLEDDDEKFGKFMSIKDEQIVPYFMCFAYMDDENLRRLREFVEKNPFEAKKQLATFFIALQHKDMAAGEKARANFERKFSHQQVSEEDCLKIKIRQGETLFTILADANVTESRAQLRRLFAANAIKTSDKKQTFTMESMPVPGIIRIGKKLFVKLEE